MSVRIREDRCVGCGACTRVCPGTLLELRSKTKGYIAYMETPEDCWGCVSCVKVCPAGAIDFYLAEDLGGPGSEETTLQVVAEGPLLHWNFWKGESPLRTITVNRQNANQY